MTVEQPTSLALDGLEKFLDHRDHCLLIGGPGSGKTTAALVKANQVVTHPDWADFRQVLFLSFARSTVARAEEAAGGLFSKHSRRRIELTTYHSFIWRLIRSYGYLYQSRKICLLPPHESAAKLANAAKGLKGAAADAAKDAERRRLLSDEGFLDFDLFAEVAAELLEGSNKLCRIMSSRYPLIYLDEFQDTNAVEYRLIQCLARNSTIIALADPEQRIYEFRGADPKRIQDFVSEFDPATFDLAEKNHRSNGTDILQFANNLLKKQRSSYDFDDVKIVSFPIRKGAVQHLWFKGQVLQSLKRSKQRSDEWSIAVLVPTKSLMLTVSDCLTGTQRIDANRTLPKLSHEVAVDAEGPALAGVIIGRLMECRMERSNLAIESLIRDLCAHIVGRKGGRPPSNNESGLIEGVSAFLTDGKVRGSRRLAIVEDCQRIVREVAALTFTGDPFVDWVSVRDLLQSSDVPELNRVATDAAYLRFLRKGAALRSQLSRIWQEQASYEGATSAVQKAFIQEHFLAKSQQPLGIHVMTIHKSKGKEFDEVVIYEGTHRHRLVRQPENEAVVAQARLSLRVAVSRARHRVTILTPDRDPCPLL